MPSKRSTWPVPRCSGRPAWTCRPRRRSSFDGGVLARVACSIQANLDSAVRIVGSEGGSRSRSPWLPGRIGGDARIVLERGDGREDDRRSTWTRDVYAVEVDAVNGAVARG